MTSRTTGSSTRSLVPSGLYFAVKVCLLATISVSSDSFSPFPCTGPGLACGGESLSVSQASLHDSQDGTLSRDMFLDLLTILDVC